MLNINLFRSFPDLLENAFYDPAQDDISVDVISATPTRIVVENPITNWSVTANGSGFSNPNIAFTGTLNSAAFRDASDTLVARFSGVSWSFAEFNFALEQDLVEDNEGPLLSLFSLQPINVNATSSVEGVEVLFDGVFSNIIVNGSPFDDVIEGSTGNDTLNGQNGNDRIIGGEGRDVLGGGNGNDEIRGGAGTDSINGGNGADRMFGGDGNDRILGEDGFDRMFGGTGNDIILAGASADRAYGGDGDDVIRGGTNLGLTKDGLFGEAGNDRIFGDGGFDFLDGGEGDDYLNGGSQADNLYGRAGNDTLYGGQGLDRLFGGTNDDLGFGGAGNDGLFGQQGNDIMYGGAGNDRFFLGAQNDEGFGNSGADRIYGGGGFDSIDGGLGDDLLEGNYNADRFIFANGHGDDIVTDFEALNQFEKLDFRNLTTINNLSDALSAATQVGGATVIDTGAGNSITLLNVNRSDLDGTDFLF